MLFLILPCAFSVNQAAGFNMMTISYDEWLKYHLELMEATEELHRNPEVKLNPLLQSDSRRRVSRQMRIDESRSIVRVESQTLDCCYY